MLAAVPSGLRRSNPNPIAGRMSKHTAWSLFGVIVSYKNFPFIARISFSSSRISWLFKQGEQGHRILEAAKKPVFQRAPRSRGNKSLL